MPWMVGGTSAVRVNLNGIHRNTRTLATGETREYDYAWRGGPRLIREPGSPEFLRSYEAAHRNKHSPNPSLFKAVIAGYLKSEAFTSTRQRTQADYLKQITKIE